MAAAVREAHLKQALDAAANGSILLNQFKRLNCSNIQELMAMAPSFAPSVPTDGHEVDALLSLLATGYDSAKDQMKLIAGDPLHKRSLTAMINSAKALAPAEAAALSAVLAPAPAPAPAAATSSTDKAALARIALELFKTAEQVHGLKVLAHERVSYTTIANQYNGAVDRNPVAQALPEYHLQLKLTSSRKEEIALGDKRYIDSESASKDVHISGDIVFFEQMELRTQCNVVHGAFDVMKKAAEKSLSPPAGDEIISASSIHFVLHPAGAAAPVAKSMNCYATPAGQKVEIDAMKLFRKRNPAATVAQLMRIDAGVQQRIADLKMQGYTGDAAVLQACTKSMELYSPALVEEAAADSDEAGGRSGKKKQKGERTADETLTSLRNQIENKDRHIANLRGGKGGGGKGGGGKGGGGKKGQGWAYPPPWSHNQPYAQPYPPPYQMPPGPPGGPPGGPPRFQVPCPPDVCRDFNFKAVGCTQANCRFKHICAVCSQNHCYRGNH